MRRARGSLFQRTVGLARWLGSTPREVRSALLPREGGLRSCDKIMPNEMTDPPVIYRPMIPADIPGGLRLCRQSRWNQRAEDWTELFTLSPQGGRIALWKDEVAGSVLTLNYENRFTWIGMLLVDPACRGQGIGSALFRQSLEVFPEISPQRLDATPQGRPVYQRFGFQDEYELMRIQLPSRSQPLPINAALSIRSMSERDLDGICHWDHQVFGADRRHLLGWVFHQAPEYAWIAGDESKLQGYCFGRHGHHFEQVGPLVADSSALAIQLLSFAVNAKPDCPFIMDVPCQHQSWRKWLTEVGFTDQRPFTRMFLGQNLYPGHPENLFAIFGPEFG
jgi:GNAT superfamily N-acetyltransferase